MTTFLLVHPEREVSPIAILVSFRGQRYKTSTGESVPVKHWNKRTKSVRVTSETREATTINDRLDLWRDASKRTVERFRDARQAPLKDDFLAILNEERFGASNGRQTLLVPYFDTFISRYEGVRSVSQIKHYKGCKRTLSEYEEFSGKRLHFADIDMDFYNRFTSWFNTKGLSKNYLGEKIKIIKVVMNDARLIDGLHYNDVTTRRGFSTPFDYSDTIYLTTDELMRIRDVRIDDETVIPLMKAGDRREHNVAKKVTAMHKARDMFLIGAFTGLRFSDYSRIRPANITDGVIRIRNRKTGVTTSVPVHWVVQEIIDSGYDFEHPLFEQKLNSQIKDVAKLAGIEEDIVVSKNLGGKPVEVVRKKWELVSSHTARRSFATNAYKAGIPSIAIMKVTGHRREATFLRYIRISEAENAEMLKSSSFFAKTPSRGVPDGVPNGGTKGGKA